MVEVAKLRVEPGSNSVEIVGVVIGGWSPAPGDPRGRRSIGRAGANKRVTPDDSGRIVEPLRAVRHLEAIALPHQQELENAATRVAPRARTQPEQTCDERRLAQRRKPDSTLQDWCRRHPRERLRGIPPEMDRK